jgi:pimeloyl-ACP methyl ester carboxylesterase
LHNPTVVASQQENHKIRIEDAMTAEIGDLGKSSLHISQTMDSAVQWQLDNHRGFIPAFISAIRHAPITAQYDTYLAIGKRLRAQKETNDDLMKQQAGLIGGKVILVLGAKDGIVIPEEQEADHRKWLGHGNVETIIMDAGHDLPISQPIELADRLWHAWEKHGVLT